MLARGLDAPVGVVCDDRAEMRHVFGRLLVRCGFVLGGSAEGYAALRELVATAQPAVAVVTLPVPGMDGLRAVRDLRAAAPSCDIVLLSAFARLDVAAVEAGATALVPEDDLQALRRALRAIASQPPCVVDLSLPDRRSQPAVPEEGAPPVPTVA